jgi:(p)ppGpp synthase/HD superfamily hydrolase
VMDSGPEAAISDIAQLLQAIEFSAYKHRTQRRKDADASPYINHPIAIAALLSSTGGVTDLAVLIAAVLHDTLEDTETTPSELEEHFGSEVRTLVEEMTDDKSLPKMERKRLQVEHASGLSAKAKLIKLADKIANVRDVSTTPPSEWNLERRREYLDWTRDVITGCRGVNPELEACYDEALMAGRRELSLEEDADARACRNRLGNSVTLHPYGRDNQSSE